MVVSALSCYIFSLFFFYLVCIIFPPSSSKPFGIHFGASAFPLSQQQSNRRSHSHSLFPCHFVCRGKEKFVESFLCAFVCCVWWSECCVTWRHLRSEGENLGNNKSNGVVLLTSFFRRKKNHRNSVATWKSESPPKRQRSLRREKHNTRRRSKTRCC